MGGPQLEAKEPFRGHDCLHKLKYGAAGTDGRLDPCSMPFRDGRRRLGDIVCSDCEANSSALAPPFGGSLRFADVAVFMRSSFIDRLCLPRSSPI